MNMKLSIVAAAVLSAAAFAFGQANTRMSTPGAKDPTEVAKAEAKADLATPAKAYFLVDEAIKIRFLAAADASNGAKLIAAFGTDAAKLDGAFSPAAEDGSQIKVYNFVTQKQLEAAKDVKAKPEADGSIDVTAIFPEMKQPGTYVLAWKGAAPLVINYLYSPKWTKSDLEANKEEINAIPEPKRAQILAQFAPKVVHVTPLEYAVISTSAGEMKATFSYDIAPHTINNYLSLAKAKYYDGTVFHRVIKGFMIQGGDPLGGGDRAGTGGPGYEINAEFSDKKHERGVLSMARSQDPNSAGSQFFIIHGKADHLNKNYSAFGQVTSGLDVVDKIAETPAGENGAVKAGERPKINSIKILPATLEMYGIK
jgi:peptidyl-prolyl cis-trans isomerase B (cyclophilin B)